MSSGRKIQDGKRETYKALARRQITAQQAKEKLQLVNIAEVYDRLWHTGFITKKEARRRLQEEKEKCETD